MDAPHFIADQNVGRLARWLRMLGFDTLFFEGADDGEMVCLALQEGRVILTCDTHILERRLVTSGKIKAVLFVTDKPSEQICQLVVSMNLKESFRPFTLCIEDNHPLVEISKESARERVPPFVFRTQEQFSECPHCGRVFWRGTHWRAMTESLEKLAGC